MLFLLHSILFKPDSASSIKKSQTIKQTQKSSLNVISSIQKKKRKNYSIACDYFLQIFPHLLIQNSLCVTFQEVILLLPFTVQLPENSSLHSFPMTFSSFTQTLYHSIKLLQEIIGHRSLSSFFLHTLQKLASFKHFFSFQ